MLDCIKYVRPNCDGTILCILVSTSPNWITVLFIVLILISFNLLGARLFGELEFWFSIIKVVTIIAMVIVGLVLIFSHLKHIMDMHHSQT